MNSHQVIIIGGGISGLAAAVKLIENGISEILILEANNRLGGRLNTIPFQNSFIELGAQWIHGVENNPIYKINEKINNINNNTMKADEMFYATQDGTKIDEEFAEEIIEKIHDEIDELEDKIESRATKQNSFGDFLKEILNKIIDKYGNENNVELIKAIFKSETNNERNESSCDNLNELSAIGWNNYENFEGNEFVVLKNGYIKLVEYLSSKIPNKLIRLNESVENINWSNRKSVKVTTYNNVERKRQEFEATKVLCTIPLGYLKKNHHKIFSPPLPNPKVNSIEKLGFGCLDKIFIVFENELFNEDFQGFQIFWRNDLNYNLEASRRWNLNDENFLKEFTTLEVLPNHRNVLFTFAVGEGAKYMENLEDECLNDVIHEILTKAFPKFNIPRPKKILRSKWYSNPFSFGSYSYIKAGSSPDDMEMLFEPLNDCLYFAGEATISKYAGTVHGAYISGQKAAELIEESFNASLFDSSESSEDD